MSGPALYVNIADGNKKEIKVTKKGYKNRKDVRAKSSKKQ